MPGNTTNVLNYLTAALCLFLSSAVADAQTPAPNSDVKSVVAAGRVNDNVYHNDYFGLTLTAQFGEIGASPFINNEAQRARLVDASSKIKSVGLFRYNVGVLIDARAKNPSISSPEQYVRAVRHQFEKEGLVTVQEEFPVELSGVKFVGAVMRAKLGEQTYHRGMYTTFLNGYILSFDVKADKAERLQELLVNMVKFDHK
jgi:hypothetical protein